MKRRQGKSTKNIREQQSPKRRVDVVSLWNLDTRVKMQRSDIHGAWTRPLTSLWRSSTSMYNHAFQHTLSSPRACVVGGALRSFQWLLPLCFEKPKKQNMFSFYLEDGDPPYSIRSCRFGVLLKQFPCMEWWTKGISKLSNNEHRY